MILVIANYRTGSTTLLKELSQKTGCRYSAQYTGEWLHLDLDYRPPSDKIRLYKVMPDHMIRNYDMFVSQYLNVADKIYFSVRKDVRSQINSLIRAHASGVWHPGDIPHIGNETITVDNSMIDKCKSVIMKNLESQKMLYDEFGGEIVYLEDRENAKYKKRFDNIIVPDYNLEISDAEEYFNE